MAKHDTLVADQKTLETAREYKSELFAKMFAGAQSVRARGASAAQVRSPLSILPLHNNVVGVGYGSKVSYSAGGAIIENELAVRVYVRSKLPLSEVPAGNKVPAKINGMPTDVIAVGDITFLGRPVKCDASICHNAVKGGNLCLLG